MICSRFLVAYQSSGKARWEAMQSSQSRKARWESNYEENTGPTTSVGKRMVRGLLVGENTAEGAGIVQSRGRTKVVVGWSGGGGNQGFRIERV